MRVTNYAIGIGSRYLGLTASVLFALLGRRNAQSGQTSGNNQAYLKSKSRSWQSLSGCLLASIRMNGDAAMSLHAGSATGKADMDSLARCKHALELMLTNCGNPSVEVDQVLADDPQFVFGHCLRAALIIRTDDDAARSKLAASVTAIERECQDIDDPARRHASAASAWFDGDQVLALERYGAILIDWPRDILALRLRMHLISALASGACCEIASPRWCLNGRAQFLATQAFLQCTLSASKRTANIAALKR